MRQRRQQRGAAGPRKRGGPRPGPDRHPVRRVNGGGEQERSEEAQLRLVHPLRLVQPLLLLLLRERRRGHGGRRPIAIIGCGPRHSSGFEVDRLTEVQRRTERRKDGAQQAKARLAYRRWPRAPIIGGRQMRAAVAGARCPLVIRRRSIVVGPNVIIGFGKCRASSGLQWKRRTSIKLENRSPSERAKPSKNARVR